MNEDTQEKKKQEILLRIQNREKERKVKEEERKAISKQENEDEDPIVFWRDFNELKNTVNVTKESVDESLQTVQEMQFLLNRSIHYLSPYDIRQADQAIKTIENDIEKVKKTETEKKKFTFKKKVVATKTPNTTPVTPIEYAPIKHDVQSLVKAKTFDGIEGEKTIPPVDYTSVDTTKLELSPDDDIVVSNCENATICFCCVSGAAYFKNLTNCTVLMGPVSGSAFLQNCTNCTIVIAARQVRIHSSTSCDFYLYTRSDPIIEHCNRIRVAPYTLEYEHIDNHFEMAQFDRKQNTEWSKVKDFNWLKQEQSPNWSLLPEEERKPFKYVEKQ